MFLHRKALKRKGFFFRVILQAPKRKPLLIKAGCIFDAQGVCNID
jgi:hypothetical protein